MVLIFSTQIQWETKMETQTFGYDPENPYEPMSIKLRQTHIPVIGDMIANRYAQMTTIGTIPDPDPRKTDPFLVPNFSMKKN